MSLAQLLGAKKKELSHVDIEENDRLNFASERLDVQDDMEYTRRMRLLDFHCWYPMIQSHTFFSKSFPMTRKDCQDLVDAHKSYKRGTSIEKIVQEDLADLRERMDHVMSAASNELQCTYGRDNHSWFVKTSCRSPKDAALGRKGLRENYLRHLSPSQRDGVPASLNEQVIAVLSAVREAFKVDCASQALDLFIRSERVQEDIAAVTSVCKEEELDFEFIVREWREIPVDMEFRAFCCDDRINCITQYDFFVQFPRLQALERQITESIERFYLNDILPRLKENPQFPREYVIDFAFAQRGGDTMEGLTIEWDHPLVTGLFDREADAKVLVGRSPFELRIKREELEDVNAISHEWRDFISK
ncbi:hypothetical protein PROFUN_06318 [Planoprotostelium fungivorum]|uniref:Cell division cycle protein 123 n=1 Tax=Planoprotostelium fungivorum TaxID=1890364 RepID=A0A2P6NP42_9EUKA|nr:hypothetical protein PROFUN_06318 [Planoprotostelium fungivorum]